MADHLSVGGSMSLFDAHVKGGLRLLGVHLGGSLNCDNGIFESIYLDSAQIKRAFSLCHGCRIHGVLDLTAAQIGEIVDEPACWPDPGHLVLDRCQYEVFSGPNVLIGSRMRLKWLALQDSARYGDYFWSQPYEPVSYTHLTLPTNREV